MSASFCVRYSFLWWVALGVQHDSGGISCCQVLEEAMARPGVVRQIRRRTAFLVLDCDGCATRDAADDTNFETVVWRLKRVEEF